METMQSVSRQKLGDRVKGIVQKVLRVLIYFVVVLQSLGCVQLFCNPMNCSPPGSSVHGISQARVLEWVAISFSRGPSRPGVCVSWGDIAFSRDLPNQGCVSPVLAGRFFTLSHQGSPLIYIRLWQVKDICHNLGLSLKKQYLYQSKRGENQINKKQPQN